MTPFETQECGRARVVRISPGSRGSCVSTPPARSPSSRARSSPTTRSRGRPPRAFYARLRRAVRRGQADHDLRPLLAGAGRGDEADGDRGHLPRRLGDVGQGLGRPRIPGPDLASYPLSQVPDEARRSVRALLTADRNQHFARVAHDRGAAASRSPEIDFRPFIIADADTGHGGDAHVRNLIRRFVEVGRPGLPHRGPEARRQEVRPPGRQGARRPRTSRSSGSTPRASSSTSCGCRASSSPAPTPRRRRSSTAAATSATSRSSWARPTSSCRATRSASWRS